MRMHCAAESCTHRPDSQAPSHVRGGERQPRFRQQQGALPVVRERRTCALQVALQRQLRGLADRHKARLRALALDPHRLGVEVQRGDRQLDRALRRAGPRRRPARASRGRGVRAPSSPGSHRAAGQAPRGEARAAASAAVSAASTAPPGSIRSARARATCGRRSAVRRRCAPASLHSTHPGRAARRSGEARARRRRRAQGRVLRTTARSARDRRRRLAASSRLLRASSARRRSHAAPRANVAASRYRSASARLSRWSPVRRRRLATFRASLVNRRRPASLRGCRRTVSRPRAAGRQIVIAPCEALETTRAYFLSAPVRSGLGGAS